MHHTLIKHDLRVPPVRGSLADDLGSGVLPTNEPVRNPMIGSLGCECLENEMVKC